MPLANLHLNYFEFLSNNLVNPEYIYIFRDPIRTELWWANTLLTVRTLLALGSFISLAFNVFHVLILSKKEMRTLPVYTLMFAICLLDIIFFLAALPTLAPFAGPRCYISKSAAEAYLFIYGVGIMEASRRSAGWLAMFMALYRVLSLKFPMSRSMQALSKPAVSLITIVLVLVMSTWLTLVVASGKRMLPTSYDYDCKGDMAFLKQPRYLLIQSTNDFNVFRTHVFLYFGFHSIPALIYALMTVLLVKELRKIAKRRRNLQNAAQNANTDAQNTTRIVTWITVFFFITEIPNNVLNMYSNTEMVHDTAMELSSYIIYFLPMINSSAHVLFCYNMSTQYRDTVKFLFTHQN